MSGMIALDNEQHEIILTRANALLQKRDWPKTICPSEVARAFSQDELTALKASGWRETMVAVREVVWELRDADEVEVLQRGEVLPSSTRPEDVSGPIRVRAKQGN